MKSKYIFIVLIILIIIAIALYFILSKNNVNEINNIKSFRFSYSVGYAYEANVVYELKCTDKCEVLIKLNGIKEEDGIILEVDDSFRKKLEEILKKYHVEKWNGFDKVDKNVLDGDSFYMSIRMENGSINASGYMMYPKNYREVVSEIDALFQEV